jgi:hypothetical protein
MDEEYDQPWEKYRTSNGKAVMTVTGLLQPDGNAGEVPA